MDITNDEKLNDDKIQPFIISKSRNCIKRSMSSNKRRYKSSSELFGLCTISCDI